MNNLRSIPGQNRVPIIGNKQVQTLKEAMQQMAEHVMKTVKPAETPPAFIDVTWVIEKYRQKTAKRIAILFQQKIAKLSEEFPGYDYVNADYNYDRHGSIIFILHFEIKSEHEKDVISQRPDQEAARSSSAD